MRDLKYNLLKELNERRKILRTEKKFPPRRRILKYKQKNSFFKNFIELKEMIFDSLIF